MVKEHQGMKVEPANQVWIILDNYVDVLSVSGSVSNSKRDILIIFFSSNIVHFNLKLFRSRKLICLTKTKIHENSRDIVAGFEERTGRAQSQDPTFSATQL